MSSSSPRRRAAASASTPSDAATAPEESAPTEDDRAPVDPMTREVPARYVGEYPVYLKPGLRRYRDGYGQPFKATRRVNPVTEEVESVYLLAYGDTLMMPEIEVCGQTLLVDPSGNRQPLWLGAGFAPLPEHAHLSASDAAGLRFMAPDGIYRFYEVHEGRPDFTLFDPAASDESAAEASEEAPSVSSASETATTENAG